MLSQPTSAMETRRKAHRRQHSTPNIEVGQLRKAPAASGIQRTQSHRAHRRGLSLDQHRSFQPAARLTPSLGPISQDDLDVSIDHDNTNAGPFPQYRNTSVAQSSLAQPGQLQLLPPGYLPHGLGLRPDFSNRSPTQFHHFDHLSPHAISPGAHSFPAVMPLTPMTPTQQFSHQPSMEQIEDLERHIKAVYGSSQVHINILPTPVSTPQKRASMALADNLDVSPLPLHYDNPEASMNQSLFGRQEPKFDPAERGYDSSLYTSPSHSTSCSPQQADIKSFSHTMHMNAGPYPVTDSMLFSAHTTLADVEHPLLVAGVDDSPSHSPRPVSLADLSIDGGTIEETGISHEEIQQFISPQDPINHRWTCLFPGCDAKTFGRRENIRSHVQTHLGDRQYRCNCCGKCFVRQHDLKRHAKIHSGNKPYKCPCGGGFARQDALTRHRQRGMCIGAFPDAVRKQSKRGRPRKHRPDMEERMDKAQRTRERAHSSSSDGSADSGAEDCPSPSLYHAELPKADTAKLVDLPEEDEIEEYGVNPSVLSKENSPSLPNHRFSLQVDNTDQKPAQPSSLDMANLASSPGDDGSLGDPASPLLPSTPQLIASSSSFAEPPTSPLCASTSTMPPDCDNSIFDELRLGAAEHMFTSSAAEHFGLPFSAAAGAPGMLGFSVLEHHFSKAGDVSDVGFHDAGDEAFKNWVMESVDFESVPLH